MQNEELLIVTNNPMVRELTGYEHDWVDGDCKQVITQTYNLVAAGHQLISHPLSGSIKPNQNPFKSILISKVPQGVDIDDLKLVGSCLRVAEEFLENKVSIDPNQYRQDLQLADHDLLLNALRSIQEGR
ncbi:MAG TPA: GrdX family protein [Syntrophomonadaceae bacterium]|nr:GrdX family protein [Syntrophomonadaceae bacterium]HRX20737.1 GrdX family protein [Syntrophomonadaceae bacterium]